MNDAEFDRLLRRHAAAINLYARAISRDRWLAEEAVQETFLRAWKYLDTFDARGSFEGWLIRLCRNCVTDVAAHQRPTVALTESHAPVASLGSSVEIEQLIRDLPRPQQEVVVLCGALGFDYESAAELLDVPIGTVRSRLHRARATLNEQLQIARDDSRSA